ncbi:MAG TPA: porin family protein [Chitinophagales bacterium]|nr:porin family protein [Chitinophagales bacterium]
MKKLFATLFLAASLFGVSHAAEKDDFQFGIRMGAQFSELKGASNNGPSYTSKNAKSLVGPAFGFIFEIPLNAYLEIRPELNFASQGQKFDIPNIGVYNYWMGYVQVPVLLRGQYGNEKVRGFVHVGPQFGFGTFILDRVKFDNGTKDKESYTFKDQKLKPFDAGITFGAGVEFPAAKGMELEVRYYAGLANINDYGVSGLETKNRSLHLTIAFKF